MPTINQTKLILIILGILVSVLVVSVIITNNNSRTYTKFCCHDMERCEHDNNSLIFKCNSNMIKMQTITIVHEVERYIFNKMHRNRFSGVFYYYHNNSERISNLHNHSWDKKE